MGGVRLAAVAVKCDRDLGNASLRETRLDHHLRREFHSEASLIQPRDEFACKSPQSAVDVVHGRAKPTPGQRGKDRISKPSMQKRHRWLGNPVFSALARRWFCTSVNDIYCGLRGFTSELIPRLDQRCLGMEFATEMVIKASLAKARIAEVPITLHRDGRKTHAPHLKTFRDGWRTLRFFLQYCPRQLFLIPGLVLTALGLFGYSLGL